MTEPLPTRFGNELRRLRLASGLSQGALAERAELSARGISDLERGARTRPRAETVRLLADALGLSGDLRASFIAGAMPIQAEPVVNESPRLPRAPTPIIGRESEIETIQTLLECPDVRL